MANVVLKNIRKTYTKDVCVIKDVNLEIQDGEFIVFVGPSGCGKSTLMRMIAGLEDITAGELRIGDVLVNDVHASKRGIAMVFQSYALYPHMSVYDNMAFALQLANTPKAEIDKQVRKAAAILELTHLLERKPKALSGGQRQRVAIGRAIVRDPKVFLFDEPLSNLDASLRLNMRVELSKLHKELKTTMLYVTHDQVEAMTLADRIVVFNGGVIQQVGTPLEMYENPTNLFVAGFLGSPKMNLFKGEWISSKTGLATVGLRNKTQVQAAVMPTHAHPKDEVTLGIRPEHIQLTSPENSEALQARVQLVEHLGDTVLAYAETDASDQIICVKLPSEAKDIKAGDLVGIALPAKNCLLFDAAGNAFQRAAA